MVLMGWLESDLGRISFPLQTNMVADVAGYTSFALNMRDICQSRLLAMNCCGNTCDSNPQEDRKGSNYDFNEVVSNSVWLR